MAIIHTTPRNSGTEATIKILDELTEDIKLNSGKILMGQFNQGGRHVLKLSLFIKEDIYATIGARNVFIEDVKDTVEIRFGRKIETAMFLELLRQTNDWERSVPKENQKTYQLSELTQAATDIRNYLLLGKLPWVEIPEQTERSLNTLLKGGINTDRTVEFNVLATMGADDEYD